jgi:hypothetical protein
MNQELMNMVQQAVNSIPDHVDFEIPNAFAEAFATLVAAAEREACAKACEEPARKWWSIHCHSNKHAETTRKAHDDFCSLQAAIRARGETK